MKDWGVGIPRPWQAAAEPVDPALDADAILARILDPDRRGALHPLYHRLRTLDPIHRSRSPRLPERCFVLTRFRDVDHVARSSAAVNDPDTAKVFDRDGRGGAFFQLMRHAMLFLEKGDHDRVRRLVYKAFTPRAIAPLRALTEATAHALLDAVEANGRMDFVRDFAYPLPIRVIGRLLGLPDEDQARVEEWAWDFARAGDPMTATAETIRRGNAAAEGFHAFFAAALDERRARPRDDLMTTLVEAEEGGRGLGREEAIATCVLLLQAGHETTADLLGNAVINLFAFPGELARLRDEPALLPEAIEELLRFEPPVQLSMRLVREPIDLGERTIPAGHFAALVYGAANRDPAVYDEPDRLRLDRGAPHLAFSAGAYYCIGNALARSEIRAALQVLLARLPSLRPDGSGWVERRTVRLRGPQALPVAWDPRH
ncbi:MAG: cytochrome P450 [Myxococcota bacterium]